MAVDLDEECPEEVFLVYNAMFPSVRPPAAEFEDEPSDDISMRGLLIEFGMKNIVQHTLFECRVAFKRREAVGLYAEGVYRQCVQAMQESVHILFACYAFELPPVYRVVVLFHEQRPIEQMSQPDVSGSEVRRGMPQQKERVEIDRRQKYLAAAYVQILARERCKSLQYCFYFAVRAVGVYVQKVEVIFDHNPADVKHRVVMLVLVDCYTVFSSQQIIRLPLASIEPNIYIAARTVLWNGI